MKDLIEEVELVLVRTVPISAGELENTTGVEKVKSSNKEQLISKLKRNRRRKENLLLRMLLLLLQKRLKKLKKQRK